ncbi:hypothetical protein DCAR_0101673 [Daucus carota subsp. sativus]|uniref:Uncharacterized protein n=1 Tax=Daucus carota subsp. sativus TaxID=79200 RepID=A0A166GKD3_DAUCS|nr:hypothetical protein DCAR_0101673 [Daucus carota subsp. sativus]
MVVPAPTDYTSMDTEFALKFHHGTNNVVQSEGSESIPRYKFQLKDLEGPGSLIFNRKNLIDIIGMVVLYTDEGGSSNGLKKLGVHIINHSTNATKTYYDIDYAPLNVLKAEVSAVSGYAIGNLPPPSGSRFMNRAPVTLTMDTFPPTVIAEAPVGDEVHLPSPLFYHGQLYVSAPIVALQHDLQKLSLHEAGAPAP